MPTPTIDALAGDGVALSRYYVTQLCSPSRTSLLSGRYPYTIGMNDEVIVNGHPSCLPLNYRLLTDQLKEAPQSSWSTAMYGKYDLGMTSWGCTPTCRGFDHFYGFYNAFNDYFSHIVGVGLDLHNDKESDFSNRNQTGVYMTELITTKHIEWIRNKVATDPSGSTFSLVAHESNHAPTEVPLHYINHECDHIPASNPTRRIVCGMMRAVDSSLANITAVYKELGIWDDTLVIFSTDNGGNPNTGGNNYPLRGAKATAVSRGASLELAHRAPAVVIAADVTCLSRLRPVRRRRAGCRLRVGRGAATLRPRHREQPAAAHLGLVPDHRRRHRRLQPQQRAAAD